MNNITNFNNDCTTGTNLNVTSETSDQNITCSNDYYWTVEYHCYNDTYYSKILAKIASHNAIKIIVKLQRKYKPNIKHKFIKKQMKRYRKIRIRSPTDIE